MTKVSNKFWGILSLVASLVLVVILSQHLSDTENLIRRLGVFGPLIVILLYGVLSLTPISTDPLTLITGALFGPFIGVLISWQGNNLASLIEYYIGYTISSVANFDHFKNKLPFNLGKFPVDSVYFLIFARLIPGYGGKIVSLAAGVYQVNFIRYLWTTVLINLLGSLLLSLGGYEIISLFH